jgi:uncharacterized repeat protein (TIGR01451 family)
MSMVLACALAGIDPSRGSEGSCAAPEETTTDPSLRLTVDSSGQWSARNERQALRLIFAGQGVVLAPESVPGEEWSWGLVISADSPPTASGSDESVRLMAAGSGVEFRLGNRSEWFVNSGKGILHGLDIHAAEGVPIRLGYRLEGNLTPKIAPDARSITFTDGGGRPVLAYRNLVASDARGRDVGVRWVRLERGDARSLVLAVESSESEFPLRVQGRVVRSKAATGRPAPDSQVSGPQIAAVPTNDLCSGAEILPGAGPFPLLSSAHDITEATTAGDPPAPSCQADISRSIWFSFTPGESGLYTLSLCGDAPTETTVEDTVLAVYGSSSPCAGLTEMIDGCDDDSCSSGDLQSVVGPLPLLAGATYYAVAWQYSTGAPDPASADVQLRIVREAPLPPPPGNDQCPGAEAIPGAGPFPYTTPLIADVSGATTVGDPPAPSCQPAVSRSVWYTFTPAASGNYTFSLCADAPTGTTLDDTVLGLYSSNGTCSGLSELAGGCDDDSCALEGNQSVINGATLTAGATYYVVAWKFDAPPPAADNTAVQLHVSQVAGPGNDRCAAAVPLSLDAPVPGTTSGALDDTELSGSTCFAGVGQTPVAAIGGDVAYRFTAPSAGSYSFRVNGYDTTRNAVIYVASDCPSAMPPAAIASCLGAANRNLNFPGEEVPCLPLTAGQHVFVYVDEASPSTGSTFTLEANRCVREVESNATPGDALPPACGMLGSISPPGEADFMSLGIPASGSRVFTIADGVASNNTGFDIRLTDTASTLEYDDADNDIPFGTLSPNLAGAPAGGTGVYLRVSHSSVTSAVEPYRLYAAVQPPSALATSESEPNNSPASTDTGPNLYFSGSLNNNNDVDHFSFSASAGDLIQIGLDLDPTRNNTPFNGTLALLDAGGAELVIVNDGGATSSITPGTGSLIATTPRSPGEGLVYRVRSGGTYYARVSTSSGTTGDYLLSIAHNCRVSPAIDLSVQQTDSPDPVVATTQVTYMVTVSNPASTPAAGVVLRDDLPAGSVLVTSSPSQGSCSGSGPVICQLGTIAGGAVAGVSLVVTAPQVPGGFTNTAQVSSYSVDPDPGNDADQESTLATSPDSDGDGVLDDSDCAPADGTAWAVPGEATSLRFPVPSDTSQMQWEAPAVPGGTAVRYDVLRSQAPDFAAASCIATDQVGLSFIDETSPSGLYTYLVRSENACGGNPGAGSTGTPRTVPACP